MQISQTLTKCIEIIIGTYLPTHFHIILSLDMRCFSCIAEFKIFRDALAAMLMRENIFPVCQRGVSGIPNVRRSNGMHTLVIVSRKHFKVMSVFNDEWMLPFFLT